MKLLVYFYVTHSVFLGKAAQVLSHSIVDGWSPHAFSLIITSYKTACFKHRSTSILGASRVRS